MRDGPLPGVGVAGRFDSGRLLVAMAKVNNPESNAKAGP
jgi:hypothetical protein